MSWFLLSILHALGMAISNIFRKIIMKNDKSDPIASGILFQLLGALIVVIFAISTGFTIPPIQKYPINFAIQGIFWGCATLCLFKAYKYIDASEVTIIVALESIITIVAAVIFLKEAFSFVNIIGTLLVIFSVIYVSIASGKMAFNKGVIYAVLYSLFAGFAVVNDAFMLRYVDVFSYLVIGWLSPGLFLIFLQPSSVKKVYLLIKSKIIVKYFIFTLIYVLAGFAFFFALSKGGQASQVNTITQASVILTVILSVIFLKEKDHLLKKFICAILVTIGVILLR